MSSSPASSSAAKHRQTNPEDRLSLREKAGYSAGGMSYTLLGNSIGNMANVVLNIAFGEPTIAVDTHIFRISNRTGLAPGKDPLAVEQKLLKFTPDEFRQHAHHWLILHGRYVCVARNPHCGDCLIRDLCEFRGKTPSKT